MKTVWSWLEGKKTYIGAIALVLVAAAGYWLGLVTDAQFGMVVAAAFAIFGQRQYAERATQMMIAEIQALKAKEAPAGQQPAKPAQ